MERFEKLFREAERIRPPAGMWAAIAARAGKSARRGGHEPGADGADGAVERGWGWKMAASMAVGVGVLAAMLAVLKPDPRLADQAGGAEDFALARAEATPLPDVDDLYWHADLGEESGMEWEAMPLLEDAAAEE